MALTAKQQKRLDAALRGAESHYFDKAGNVVNGTRQFAGFVTSGMTPGQAAAKQAKYRAEGKAKYIAKIEASFVKTAQGGKTLKSAYESKGTSARRGGGGGGGPKRPKMTCKLEGGSYKCSVGGRSVGTISIKQTGNKLVKTDYKDGSHVRGDKLPVYAYKASQGNEGFQNAWVSKLRVAKRRLADAVGARI